MPRGGEKNVSSLRYSVAHSCGILVKCIPARSRIIEVPLTSDVERIKGFIRFNQATYCTKFTSTLLLRIA